MHRRTLLIVGALAAVGLCSCGKKPTGADKPVIAVIPKGTTHIFWKSIHAGAVKAATELDVEIIWKGPLKEDDRESQITVVENLIARGVDGIVLAPLDDVALRAPTSAAMRAGIPVVIIDSALQGEDYVSFVATDNYVGGQKGARHLAQVLGGRGRVVMLRYQEGSASTANREKGFLDAIKEFPDIEVVSANQYGGATTESAMIAAENLLAPLKKADGSLQIDGIFCPNESTAFAMLRVLQDQNLAGKVTYVGFDSSPMLVKAMREGQIHGLVLQDPINMGYLGVKTLVRHLNGEKVDRRIDTGSTVATPENMDSPEIERLLNPDYRKYLGEG